MTGAALAPVVDEMAHDHLDALDALIDAQVQDRSALPPLWHWTYFLDRPRQDDLGPDGHRLVGHPTPPGPGLRRMFAGGRVTTTRPLVLGRPARLRISADTPRRKDGRSGPLWFVTVEHQYEQDGNIAIVEQRDIVYRDVPESEPTDLLGTPGTDEIADIAGKGVTLGIDETVLFRFSALTYNAHRIHYDRQWAAHEGYAGLVVHGPLQAIMMGEHLRRGGVDLTGHTFSYRLISPFVGTQLMRVRDGVDVGRDETCAVVDARGTVTAVATLTTSSTISTSPSDAPPLDGAAC